MARSDDGSDQRCGRTRCEIEWLLDPAGPADPAWVARVRAECASAPSDYVRMARLRWDRPKDETTMKIGTRTLPIPPGHVDARCLVCPADVAIAAGTLRCPNGDHDVEPTSLPRLPVLTRSLTEVDAVKLPAAPTPSQPNEPVVLPSMRAAETFDRTTETEHKSHGRCSACDAYFKTKRVERPPERWSKESA